MDAGNEVVPKGIRSDMVTLAGLLTKTWIYRMPPFQRQYSWTEVQVGRLVEDVRAATAYQDPYYFLGQIVVLALDGDAFVIDGQQRLATLTVLLAYLRDKADDRGLAHALQRLIAISVRSSFTPRLYMRPLDEEFFRTWVQTPGKIEDLIALKSVTVRSQRLIQLAARTIGEALDELTPEERAEMARFMAGKLTFNLIETDDRDGASALFRLINYDGLRPSDSTIIRSELLDHARLDEPEAATIADRWDRLEDDIGDASMAQLWATIELIVSGEAPTERRARRPFHSRVIEHADVAQFLREDMWRYVDIWGEVRRCEVDGGEASAEINRRIACMHLYAYHERGWIAPAIAMIADHGEDKALLERFFRALEKYTFACMMGAIKDNRRRSERFARIVRARGVERTLFGHEGPLQLTSAQTNRLIEKINAPLEPDDNRGRIIAMRVNAALPGHQCLALTSGATLEHVLPKSPSEFWRKKFPSDERRTEYTYLIGNFALLKDSQNRAAANKDWDAKRQIYFKTRGAPTYALTADIQRYKDWNETTLRRRHQDLVEVLCKDLDLV